MKRLQLIAGKGLDGYSSSATGRGWKAGEVRPVSDEVATYLTSTFPEAFIEAKDEAGAPRKSSVVAVENGGPVLPELRDRKPEPKPEPEPKKPPAKK